MKKILIGIIILVIGLAACGCATTTDTATEVVTDTTVAVADATGTDTITATNTDAVEFFSDHLRWKGENYSYNGAEIIKPHYVGETSEILIFSDVRGMLYGAYPSGGVDGYPLVDDINTPWGETTPGPMYGDSNLEIDEVGDLTWVTWFRRSQTIGADKFSPELDGVKSIYKLDNQNALLVIKGTWETQYFWVSLDPVKGSVEIE